MWKRLGDLLIDEGLITKDQLNQALSQQKENGGRLGSILVQMGLLQMIRFQKLWENSTMLEFLNSKRR